MLGNITEEKIKGEGEVRNLYRDIYNVSHNNGRLNDHYNS
jgi:hypothetical protein